MEASPEMSAYEHADFDDPCAAIASRSCLGHPARTHQ